MDRIKGKPNYNFDSYQNKGFNMFISLKKLDS